MVTDLLTGLHEPEASHLGVLEAVAGRELVDRACAAMTAPGAPPYRWHEFGDAMLLLPSPVELPHIPVELPSAAVAAALAGLGEPAT